MLCSALIRRRRSPLPFAALPFLFVVFPSALLLPLHCPLVHCCRPLSPYRYSLHCPLLQLPR